MAKLRMIVSGSPRPFGMDRFTAFRVSAVMPSMRPSFTRVPVALGQSSKRRYSEVDTVAIASQTTMTATDPKISVEGIFPSSDFGGEVPNNKPGRVKACLDCRKSKVSNSATSERLY
jgi:hypothetical protein